MTTANPDLNSHSEAPPYSTEQILSSPFSERVRLACRTFAAQSPNQPKVMALYWAKYFFFYIGGWALWCAFSADYAGFSSPLEWAFTLTAFKKAIAWSIFYELSGFGCGWGPMNARINPLIGGYKHFARPGTIKLPVFKGAPLIGGHTRNGLDVGLYVLNQLCLLRVLVAPEVTPELLMPSFVLIPLMGILDKTLYLAARAEHYYVALVCLVLASGDELWISGCKLVWCFIWFWAATSKINHHFPSVIMFMMNNGPFFPKFLKNGLFKSYPDDLRASRFATFMAHFGTVNEYSIPVILLLVANDPILTALALVHMVGFHGFIALNNPNGMPIEWNILMIYGGIFLFGFHPGAELGALTAMPLLLAALLFSLAVIPTIGNFFPKYVSFLLSMRYYAGNWAYNVWFIKKGGSEDKLDELKKASGTLKQQLMEVMDNDENEVRAAIAMMLASRFMHLQGRPLLDALPLVADDIEDYEWHEGELIGGTILGWNFGDGHLNGVHLLEAVQSQCQFEEGEVRVLSVESQPLFGPNMDWKIFDAASGLIEEGSTHIDSMRGYQPYPEGEHAAAIARGRSAAKA